MKKLFAFSFTLLTIATSSLQADESLKTMFHESCQYYKENMDGLEKHKNGLRHFAYVYEEVAYRCDHDGIKNTAKLFENSAQAFEYTVAACGTGNQELFYEYLHRTDDNYVLGNMKHEFTQDVYLEKDDISESMESEILQYYDLTFLEFDPFYMLKPENISCDMIIED